VTPLDASKRQVQFVMSGELVRRILGMPDGTMILAAEANWVEDSMRLTVAHLDLPVVDTPTICTPFVTKHDDGSLSWNWGLPE
jgi:hypothetical protein